MKEGRKAILFTFWRVSGIYWWGRASYKLFWLNFYCSGCVSTLGGLGNVYLVLCSWFGGNLEAECRVSGVGKEGLAFFVNVASIFASLYCILKFPFCFQSCLLETWFGGQGNVSLLLLAQCGPLQRRLCLLCSFASIFEIWITAACLGYLGYPVLVTLVGYVMTMYNFCLTPKVLIEPTCTGGPSLVFYGSHGDT